MPTAKHRGGHPLRVILHAVGRVLVGRRSPTFCVNSLADNLPRPYAVVQPPPKVISPPRGQSARRRVPPCGAGIADVVLPAGCAVQRLGPRFGAGLCSAPVEDLPAALHLTHGDDDPGDLLDHLRAWCRRRQVRRPQCRYHGSRCRMPRWWRATPAIWTSSSSATSARSAGAAWCRRPIRRAVSGWFGVPRASAMLL